MMENNENRDSQAEVNEISRVYQCLKCNANETYFDNSPRFCSKCGEPMIFKGMLNDLHPSVSTIQAQETEQKPEAVEPKKVLSMQELFAKVKAMKEAGKSEEEIDAMTKEYLGSGSFDVSKHSRTP